MTSIKVALLASQRVALHASKKVAKKATTKWHTCEHRDSGLVSLPNSGHAYVQKGGHVGLITVDEQKSHC